MLDDAKRESAANRLLDAYRTRRPIEPLVDTYPRMDMKDAYAIQQIQVGAWRESGRTINGHKVGLTSKVMQRQMRVEQPDFGVLRDDMFKSQEEQIDTTEFISPRIEPEVAFVLGRDLVGPGVDVQRAAGAVDFVLPALEIIDSRIRDWRISIMDTIADNASSGAVVLGTTPRVMTEMELCLTECELYADGRLAATGMGSAILGSPLLSLAWLANTLALQNSSLRAGDIVLPGSVTSAQTVTPGNSWTARFSGLGNVTANFGKVSR